MFALKNQESAGLYLSWSLEYNDTQMNYLA